MSRDHAIVIGAGPAGLGTALALVRQGISVDVLERQTTLGGQRRGETIRFHPAMEALLGPGFFDRLAIHRIRKRRYYSHSGQRTVDRTIANPNIIIDWTAWIQAMAAVVTAAGARIALGTEVLSILEDGGRVGGVRVRTPEGGEQELTGTVFSCGGIADPGGQHIGLDRKPLDRPVRKWLLRDYAGPDDRLEYHFHVGASGLMIGAIFPRSRGEVEMILLGMTGAAPPDLDAFAEAHPIFKDRLRGATPFYHLDTAIPMGAMHTRCCPRPGLVMTGDALGHVQGRGGSGIRASFLIGYGAGTLGAQAMRDDAWQGFNAAMARNPELRALYRHNLLFSRARMLMYRPSATPASLDRVWPLLKSVLR